MSSSDRAGLITETIRVVCRLRPSLDQDASGGGLVDGRPSSSSLSSSAPSSPRITNVKGSTFITPADVGAGNAACYENAITSLTSSGSLTYSKNYGSDSKTFNFDACCPPEVSQSKLFDGYVRDIVDGVMQGYHGTVLAYGQTGSGKTYTMMGPAKAEEQAEAGGSRLVAKSEDAGIIPRALALMFATSDKSPGEYTFEMSYLQIYCEVLQDMLSLESSSSSSPPLVIRDKGVGLHVENLTSLVVPSASACLQLLAEGDRRRATASTLLNATSSRSHAACVLRVTRRPPTAAAGSGSETDNVTVSNLVLVDLAGSERAKASGARFQQFEELKSINLSLSALGNCISALAAGKSHVPFRDSKLTRLLQYTLGGSSRTAMIVCVRPGDDVGGETYSTLQFAKRAANVKVVARRNVVVDYEQLYKELQVKVDGTEDGGRIAEMREAKLRQELEMCKEELQDAQAQRDMAMQRLTSLEGGFRASLQAMEGEGGGGVGGGLGSDVASALEAVADRWQREVESLQMEQARELGAAKMKFQQQLQAYKAAANGANADVEAADGELERERQGHLESIRECGVLKEKLKVLERDNSGRIAELLAEMNDKNASLEELEGMLERQQKDHAEVVDRLGKRLEELEQGLVKRKEEDRDMVSREAVMEMEALFSETVEKLMRRVNMLEANAKENRETREIRDVGMKIEKERQQSMDPASRRLLEQMEANARSNPLGLGLGAGGVGVTMTSHSAPGPAGMGGGAASGQQVLGGGGARLAPGRPRVANPRQAF